jgi:spore maturation protein CgeB
MKIVIFGLSISSSWGNGHATLWRGLCRALQARGHRIVFFERDVPYYATHRDLHALGAGSRLVLFSAWDDVSMVARRELSDADVAIVTSYCPDSLAAQQLLAEAPALRVFYDLDTPVTLAELKSGARVAYLGEQGLADFDLVLSYTGGAALTELALRLGARRVEPLYGSVDPEVHRPVPPVPEFRSHLSYLGTYAADRQEALARLFLEPARRCPSERFALAGAQYPEAFPWSPNIFFLRHLEPEQHPAFFCSSRMTLNVTRAAMAAMGWCPSGRLFEAAACGVPILSDDWEGLDSFFEPGREILLADSTEQALQALQLSDRELCQIAAAARQRTLAEHTAAHRAAELEQMLCAVPA